jgi:hypothetical protein
MRILNEIKRQYFEIDDQYSEKEFKARARGYIDAEKSWKRKRELNNLAYFLFLFTRLEDQIRDQSSKLVKDKQTKLKNWKKRAAWDILEKGKRINLMKRVALLIDKGSHHYQKTKKYYDDRNMIAHGGVLPIIMPDVFQDMQILFQLLKK